VSQRRVDLRAIAERVLRLEGEAILGLIAKLDDRFERAVEVLSARAGRVIVTGMGKSGLIGRKIAATLASTGTPAYFLHPAEGVHGDIGMMAREDVVLALSNSGETDEVLAVLPAIKRLGASLILLTGSPASTLAGQADVVLDVGVREEACPMNLAPTSSTTAALAMALLDLRGVRAEDYAALHPRGSLGWKALGKVGDLMRTGDAVPVVREGASMKEAIEEMNAKNLGMTTVVNTSGRLVGVITDGDLRRHQLVHGDLLDRRAGDCMTANPKRIGANELAARALALMEGVVTSLVIADETGRPTGVIHIHDILRAKII